jgi:molybdate transport system substrate-binding protein
MRPPSRTITALRGALAVVAVATLLGGCGSEAGGTSAGTDTVIVSAASSLKGAFTAYGEELDPVTPRFSFAGSDMLAAQIREGLRPDIFAAANTKLPDELYAAGLVEKPRVFTGNRLVLAVPAGSTRVSGLDDLADDGVKIAAGSESVPVGSYTRKVLARLGTARSRAILANVRSSEPDVAGVVGKLTQRAVDAGFVYITDVRAAGDRLRAIELPTGLQPRVAYGVAIVKGAKHAPAARDFVAGLLAPAGQRALRHAGFEPPPS